MTRTFLDLSGRLPSHERVLREVTGVTSELGVSFFVVGALARDIIMELGYGIRIRRSTGDLDCGVRVESWAEFNRLRDGLLGTGRFTADDKQLHRVRYEGGLAIDVVPFGPIESDSGAILWPPEGEIMMNTLGFDEAYASAVEVRLAEDLVVLVSSLPGLALMKLFAWSDRRHEYTKDALDLAFIMSNYIDAGNGARVYEEGGDANDLLEDFDHDLTNARLLGRDVGRLLTPRSRPAALSILEGQTGEKNHYPLAEAMIRNGENYRGDFDVALAALEMLKKGILESEP